MTDNIRLYGRPGDARDGRSPWLSRNPRPALRSTCYCGALRHSTGTRRASAPALILDSYLRALRSPATHRPSPNAHDVVLQGPSAFSALGGRISVRPAELAPAPETGVIGPVEGVGDTRQCPIAGTRDSGITAPRGLASDVTSDHGPVERDRGGHRTRVETLVARPATPCAATMQRQHRVLTFSPRSA